jgi:hypothetical protein
MGAGGGTRRRASFWEKGTHPIALPSHSLLGFYNEVARENPTVRKYSAMWFLLRDLCSSDFRHLPVLRISNIILSSLGGNKIPFPFSMCLSLTTGSERKREGNILQF